MILKKEEIANNYIEDIVKKIINKKNNKFINILSKLNIESKVYRFKDFEYIYGYSETFGYYFIAIDEYKEGFFWLNPLSYEKNENGFFYTTKNYSYVEDVFKNIFSMEDFREIYINYIRTETIEKDLKSFFAVVYFRSFPWFKTFNKKVTSKIILAYLFNKIYENNEVINILDTELNNFNLELDRDNTSDLINSSSIIKASTFTAINISKIMKEEVSFIDIINYDYPL